MSQFDLFAVGEAPRSGPPAPRHPAIAAAPTLASLLPHAPIAWERRLAAAGAVPLELLVSALWTGVVIEVLSLPDRRLFLHRDGMIQEGVPRDDHLYRRAFLTAAEARRIAARIPLGLIGPPGTGCCRLREADAAWPELAEWLDGIEAAEEHELRARV